ncbi:MAG: aminopeptidase P N-terminal domain-containing protein [Deltaproteobacteria bacterium]|nr:aminopeptidase P N-terminal domain-containing protein [Deltaproteobacteria bacterium]
MSKEIFRKRRADFMKKMKGGAALFLSAPQYVRNNDVQHPYRQESDFHYLSGFSEPDSAFLLLPEEKKERFVMFVLPRDPEQEMWTGKRTGVEGALESFGADAAHPIDKLREMLPKYLTHREKLFFSLGRHPDFDGFLIKTINQLKWKGRKGIFGPWEITDPAVILWDMRLVKDGDEIKNLRRACDIAVEAQIAAMKNARAGMMEYEIQAMIESVFIRNGSRRAGFESIVASGNNATVLHYIENGKRISGRDLVLADIGCEYGFMTSDITRVFPAGRKFSPAQKAVYEIVLQVNKSIIEKASGGAMYQDLQSAAVKMLSQGMLDLKLLKGNLETIIETVEYKKFFPHRIGHYLGTDVHDVGAYFEKGLSVKLRKGSVLTVEPGLYVQKSSENVPDRFRGIGVRIEDDIIITDGRPEVLTSGAPKEIEDIEDIRK